MNEKEDGEDEEERQETDDEEWRPPAEVQTDQIRLFQINIKYQSPCSQSRRRVGRSCSRANSPEPRLSVSERKRSMESFETELEDTQKAQLRRKKKGSGSVRRRRLDPALQGLMGEANLR